MLLVHKIVRYHPHLTAAIVAGSVVSVALPWQWNPITRALIGWNVSVWIYLVLIGWLMARASAFKVKSIAEREDQSALLILTVMTLAATASIAAIILELSTLKGLNLNERLLHYALTGSTIFGSWCFVGFLFTLHYARVYFQSPPNQRALRFPDQEENPNYWDFLYFSFTIAVAAQTSDISVMSRPMRKVVLAQSVLSFLFNITIIGLSINIVAGLVGT